MSVILDIQPNADYEPSESEIIEYGKWLGMELPQDNAFLWIAREGLKAPLPKNWKACKSEKGELYYFNFKTGQSIWDHPMDEHFKELLVSEKNNPGPRSLANGAPKKTSTSAKSSSPAKNDEKQTIAESQPSSQKQEHKQDHKQQKRKHIAPLNTQNQNTKDGTTLEAVKVKRQLPDNLLLDSHSSQTKLALPAASLSTPINTEKSPNQILGGNNSLKNGSPENLQSKNNLSLRTGNDMSNGSIQDTENFVASGLNGLKALSKRSASMGRKLEQSSQSHSPGEKSASTTSNGVSSIKDPSERGNDTQSTIQQYRSEAAESFQAEKRKVEMEYAQNLEELKNMYNRKIQDEKTKIENQYNQQWENMKMLMDQQYQKESVALENSLKERIEQKRMETEKDLERTWNEYIKEKHHEVDARKEIYAQALLEAGSVVNDLKQLSNSFTKEYLSAYETFMRSVFSPENGIGKLKDLREENRVELSTLQMEHKKEIEAEKKAFDTELANLREKHKKQVATLRKECEEEVEEMQKDLEKEKKKIDSERKETLETAEKAVTDFIESLREAQQQEVAQVKREMGERMEEEIKKIADKVAAETNPPSSSVEPPEGLEPDSRTDSRTKDSRAMSSSELDPPVPKSEKKKSPGAPPLALDALYLQQIPSSFPDLKAVVTEALREVFAESPFTLTSPAYTMVRASRSPTSHGQSSSSPAGAAVAISTPTPAASPSQTVNKEVPKEKRTVALPASYCEQRRLVEGEKFRLTEGRRFLEGQRTGLEERRQQLKKARHQWKQDVIAAKKDGMKSSSNRGKLLTKVRGALDEQIRSLEHDQAILLQSEQWLFNKERLIKQLESQLDEQERLRAMNGGIIDNSYHSIDTTGVVTGFFKPRDDPSHAISNTNSANTFTPLHSPQASIFQRASHASGASLAETLTRLEYRLTEIAAIVQRQQGSTTETRSEVPTLRQAYSENWRGSSQ